MSNILTNKDYINTWYKVLAAAGNPTGPLPTALNEDHRDRWWPYATYRECYEAAGNGFRPYLEDDGWWYLTDGLRTIGVMSIEPVGGPTPIYVVYGYDWTVTDSFTVFVHTDLEKCRAAGYEEEDKYSQKWGSRLTITIAKYVDGKSEGVVERF